MTDEEKYLFNLLDNKRRPIDVVGNSIVSNYQTKESTINNIFPNIHEYLGLKGGLFGGRYFIDPQQPNGYEVPIKLNFQRPMLGGEFNASLDLLPKDKSFMLNYKRNF